MPLIKNIINKIAPKHEERKEERKENREERKEERKTNPSVIKKAVQNVKKVSIKVVSKGKNVVKNLPFATLLPFKGIMKNHLSKKGIKVNDDLANISVAFAKSVTGGQHFYNPNMYDENPIMDFEGAVFRKDPNQFSIGEDVAIAAAKAVINAVLEYFKQLKDKKNRGEKLTEDEQNLLDKTEKATQAVIDAGVDTGMNAVKDFLFSWKGGLLLLGIIAGAVLLFSKKK